MLREGIKIKNINWKQLSENTNERAIDLLTYKNKIDWYHLSKNDNDKAIDLLLLNPDKIDFNMLSMNINPRAITILSQNYDKINWNLLSANHSAADILLSNPEKIQYAFFSTNKNIRCVEYLLSTPQKIQWDFFFQNPNDLAVEYIFEHSDKLRSFTLSALEPFSYGYFSKWLAFNTNDRIVDLLLANPNHIHWDCICANSNPKVLLHLETLRHLDYYYLGKNKTEKALELIIRDGKDINYNNPFIFI
jgi:hypothetical protein